jgi:hypothetical protein
MKNPAVVFWAHVQSCDVSLVGCFAWYHTGVCTLCAWFRGNSYICTYCLGAINKSCLTLLQRRCILSTSVLPNLPFRCHFFELKWYPPSVHQFIGNCAMYQAANGSLRRDSVGTFETFALCSAQHIGNVAGGEGKTKRMCRGTRRMTKRTRRPLLRWRNYRRSSLQRVRRSCARSRTRACVLHRTASTLQFEQNDEAKANFYVYGQSLPNQNEDKLRHELWSFASEFAKDVPSF